jgi:hypothetical protein
LWRAIEEKGGARTADDEEEDEELDGEKGGRESEDRDEEGLEDGRSDYEDMDDQGEDEGQGEDEELDEELADAGSTSTGGAQAVRDAGTLRERSVSVSSQGKRKRMAEGKKSFHKFVLIIEATAASLVSFRCRSQPYGHTADGENPGGAQQPHLQPCFGHGKTSP